MVPALDSTQQRALGTLIEKSFTTPQYYPLTTSALLAGCNQATSRDPVTSFDERELLDALDTLRHQHGLVRVIHPSHGRSVDRWRHVIDEALGLIDEEVALLGVLMLRGPQTVAELRTRTERMAKFDEPDTVESTLHRLSSYPDPLARCVGRQPGQSQDRWVHLLGSGVPTDDARRAPMEEAASRAHAPGEEAASPPPPASVKCSSGDAASSPAPIDVRVADLEERVQRLEAEIGELREQLGG